LISKFRNKRVKVALSGGTERLVGYIIGIMVSCSSKGVGKELGRQLNRSRNFIKTSRRYQIRFAMIVIIFVMVVVTMGNHIYQARAAASSNTNLTPLVQNARWSMYLHDVGHSSYNPAEKVINPSTVGSLMPRWIDRVGGAAGQAISTQVVTANGLIYWGDWNGYEHATNPTNPPTDVWTTFLGQTAYNADCSPPQLGVASTATIASVNIGGTMTSVVFVGGGDGTYYALNALTGQKIWSTSFGATSQGYFAWSSPTLWQGFLYIGIASWGDCPLVQGEFVKVRATTGKIVKTWYPSSDDKPDCIGGGIWSSAAIDKVSNKVYFNTGTTGSCLQYGEAVIELNASDLSLVGLWQVPVSEQVSDGDFGASPTLFTATIGGTVHNMVGEQNKNGIYYAFYLDQLVAGPVWETRLADSPDNIASSAWDGTRLFLAANNTTLNGTACEASLDSVDPATGAFLWQACLAGGKIDGTVTAVPGLAVVAAGSIIYAVATTTTPNGVPGQILFSFQDTSYNWYYAGPSIFNGVMYAPNSDGNFYAFTPNGQ
jgi:polyvinyl alcohol dehydrogenase (cytochrome)